MFNRLLQARRYKIVIFTTILLMLPLFIYYFIYIPNQRESAVSRYFRLLSIVGDNIEATIQNQLKIIRNVATHASADSLHLKDMDTALKQVSNLEWREPPFMKRDSSLESGTRLWIENNIQGFWLNIDYSTVIDLTRAPFEQQQVLIPVKTNLKDLLTSLTQSSSFEEILVITDSGRVVFQRNPEKLRINQLDSLPPLKNAQKAGSINYQLSGVYQTRFGGTAYQVFIHPLRIPLGGNNKTGSWVVCGLVENSRFQKEVQSIDYLFIIIFLFLIVLSILSWPLLKIVFMSKNEKLRLSEVLFILLSFLVGAALVNIALLEFYFYSGVSAKLDTQLVKLSEAIRTNVNREVNSMYAQLEDYNHLILNSDGRQRFQASPTRINLLTDKTSQLFPEKYPWFEMVYWMDKLGRQQFKWTIKDQTTSLINVASRDYFQKIVQNEWWSNPPPQDTVRFWLEQIYSWNTGENLTVLSVPTGNDSLVAAAMVGQPLSIMNPVLPEGYGYAIIDAAGKVLFHEEEDKNLRENIFRESDDDRWLMSAISGEITDIGTVTYMGQKYRFYVQPLQPFPWYLIVFRNNEIFQTINVEILTIALIIFVLYALLFLLIIGFTYIARPGYRARWIWPNPVHLNSYKKLTPVFLVIIAVLFFWITLFESFQILHMAFLLPFTGLVAAYIIIRYPEVSSPASLWGAFLILGILIILILFTAVLIFHDFLWTLFVLAVICATLIFSFKNLKRPAREEEQTAEMPRYYVGLLLLSLLLVSILPSYGFFKIGMHLQSELFIKYVQKNLFTELELREQNIKEYYRTVQIPDTLLKQRLNPRNNDVYSDFFFDTRIESLQTSSQSTTSRYSLWQAPLKRFMLYLIPLYNRVTIQSRGLLINNMLQRPWKWQKINRSLQPDSLVLSNQNFPAEESSLQIISQLPSMYQGFFRVILLLSAFLLLIFLTIILLRFIAKRVFIIHLNTTTFTDPVDFKKLDEISHHILLIGPPASGKSELLKSKVPSALDLTEITDPKRWEESWAAHLGAGEPVAGLDHFEFGISEPLINTQKLLLLENLIYKYHKRIVISSTIDPLLYFSSEGWEKAYHVDVEKDLPATIQNRWVNVLGIFIPYYHYNPGDLEKFRRGLVLRKEKQLQTLETADEQTEAHIEELFQQIYEECCSHAYLQEMGLRIAESVHLPEFSSDQLLYQMSYWTDNYYQALWSTLTREEKLLLLHLAQKHFVNYKNAFMIWRLMKRNLVKKDPIFRLMNESFRTFVLSKQETPEIVQWEQEEVSHSSWSQIKVPLILAVAVIIIFLFTTQPDLFDTTFTFLTVSAAAIPALLRLMDVFRRDKPDK
ncbi:MAG: cache domain-containing protein [Calditrichia bacterium]